MACSPVTPNPCAVLAWSGSPSRVTWLGDPKGLVLTFTPPRKSRLMDWYCPMEAIEVVIRGAASTDDVPRSEITPGWLLGLVVAGKFGSAKADGKPEVA